MQFTEHYQPQTWRKGEDIKVVDLFGVNEDEALTKWAVQADQQPKGSRVELVRVMTVTMASSSK